MSLLSTIIEHLTSITEKLNEISVNSKRVDELPIATNGSKLIAVFNQSNSKTQKQSLTDLLATISNQDNFNVVYEISSSLLTTNDISGLLNYINNLPAPSLVITQVQSSVKYKIIETGDVYELVGIGKGTYGIAFGQLTLNNILLINSNQNKNEFKTLGTTILTNSDLLISLGYSWEYNSVLYSNPTAKNFPIPFTTAGKQRIDIFVATTNNNFARIQGVESVSSPVKPDVPQNTLELTFVLVGDAEIADPVLPNFGETFVEKIEKTEISVNTNNIFDVSSRVANFILGNNVVQCSGINFTDNSVYYDGKKYSFKNISTTDKILKNRTLVGNVRFVFPNELDFILKPGEIVEFILRKRKFLFLEYVGVLAQKKYKYLTANTTLENSFHETTVYVQATINITIPAGLRGDFNCTFRTFTGAVATFLNTGTVLNAESSGDVLAQKSMCYLAVYSLNNYLLTGGDLS